MVPADELAMVFDVLLAAAIVTLAVLVLFIPGLYRAAVLFITFGLMLALAWVRLEAYDIALAEAAIGAGLLGALIVGAVHQIERQEQQDPADESARADRAGGGGDGGDRRRSQSS